MPKTNVIFVQIPRKIQGVNEPFELFVTDLRLLVKDCNYANSEEIRDAPITILVSGIGPILF